MKGYREKINIEQCQSLIISAVNPEKEKRKSRKPKQTSRNRSSTPNHNKTWWKYVECKID